MFKRICLLLLLLALALPAAAEDTAPDSLYLLVNHDAAGVETPVGSAVLFSNQYTLLTSVWAVAAQDDLYAVGAGGSFHIDKAAVVSEESELVLLSLEEAAPAAPLTFASLEGLISVVGYQGTQAVSGAIDLPSYMFYDETPTLLYTAPTTLLPGSALLGENGGLVGITLAAYGEGEHRYVAVAGDEFQSLFSTSAAPTLPEGVSWVTGFTATPSVGKITVDWADALPACEEENCTIGLFFTDVLNPYYSYITLEQTGSTDLPLTPGHTYKVWVQHTHGDLVTDVPRPEEAAVSVTLPEALPFDRFDYQDREFYISAIPAEQAADSFTELLPPLKPITAQALADPDAAIFLQASSTYTITETSEVDLLVVLTTPEGYTFDYLGLFIFDMALQQSDVWNVDITEMFSDYLLFNDTGAMTSGEYTLCYYLDGALANQISWTLE